MIDILALLKRIEWHGMNEGDCCPLCRIGPDDKPDKAHFDDCQLKAAIDALESKELVVINGDELRYME